MAEKKDPHGDLVRLVPDPKQRTRLLEAVGPWIRHRGKDENRALDRALRPLSDDPVERGLILSVARHSYLDTLSDAEIAALGVEAAHRLAQEQATGAAGGNSDRDELERSVLRSLEHSLAGRESLTLAESLLLSPLLLQIPLASFGIEGLPDGGEHARADGPITMGVHRYRLQKIVDSHGVARACADAVLAECLESGVVHPHLRQHERDALLWTRFLLDGTHEDGEDALQHVCRLTGRKRDTVHRNISRFYGEAGIKQPAPLPQTSKRA